MRRTGFQLMVSLSVALVTLPVARGHARVWRVERDGSGNYATIQPAIDAAAPGDTIQLGPGRYTETTTTSFPGFTVQSHAVVEKGPLTFLARVPGEAIIGPTVRNDVGFGPHGMSISATAPGIRVEGLVVENVFDGIYVKSGQSGLTIRQTKLRGSFNGLSAFGVAGLSVLQSRLEANESGATIGPNATAPMVTECTFRENTYFGAVFIGCLSAVVDSCTVIGAAQGMSFQQGSSGTLTNSSVTGSRVAVSIALAASGYLSGNRVAGEWYALEVHGRSMATGIRNVLSGGQFATVICSDRAQLWLSESHILRGGGYSVETQGYPDEPIVSLDLRHNYWGTGSSDSVAAWIHDGLDDPTIKAVIDFDPILLHPVPSAQSSLGSLKAKFR